MQAIVLLSGGIDSMACIHFYLNQGYCIEALFCDYGQPASVREMESAKTISKYYKMPLHIIRTTDIKIPKTVTKIGYGAFAGCTNLKYVKIPKDKNYDTKWKKTK